MSFSLAWCLFATTGLECDVAFNNVLAIRNTQLLALYNEVDPRVKILAYLIKYWAKRRDINCPGEGTLSSYGYILCLIQFLQVKWRVCYFLHCFVIIIYTM